MKKLLVAMIIGCVTLVQANAQDKTKGPSIKFEKDVHDYGTIENGGNGVCEFKFTNDGTEPLKITTCRASCGCTVPSWPREEILPGKSSTIKVKYDTKRTGNIYKTITITSNAVNAPRKVISIKGKVKPPTAKPANGNTPVAKKVAPKPAKATPPPPPPPPAKKAVKVKKRRWWQFWKKKN